MHVLVMALIALAVPPLASAAGFPIAATVQAESSVAVAFDGTNFLVSVQGSGVVGAQLVSPSGALLGAASVPRTGDAPHIAFDGTNYLLVWSDHTSHPSVPVHGQLVSKQAALVGSPFLVSQTRTSEGWAGWPSTGRTTWWYGRTGGASWTRLSRGQGRLWSFRLDRGRAGGKRVQDQRRFGQRKSDVAVYHPPTGLWFIRQSSTGTTLTLGLGGSEYAPVAGDYDGDGKTDIAVYHTACGSRLTRSSATGPTTSLTFGGPGFDPIY